MAPPRGYSRGEGRANNNTHRTHRRCPAQRAGANAVNLNLERSAVYHLPAILRALAQDGDVSPVMLVDLAAAIESGGSARITHAEAARAAGVSVPTARRARHRYAQSSVLRYRPGGRRGGHEPSQIQILIGGVPVDNPGDRIRWTDASQCVGISDREIPSRDAGISGALDDDPCVVAEDQDAPGGAAEAAQTRLDGDAATQEVDATDDAAEAAWDAPPATSAPSGRPSGLEGGWAEPPPHPAADDDAHAEAPDPGCSGASAHGRPADDGAARTPGAAACSSERHGDPVGERAAAHRGRTGSAAGGGDRAAGIDGAPGAGTAGGGPTLAQGDVWSVSKAEMAILAGRLRTAIRLSGRVTRPVARVQEIADAVTLLATLVGGVDLAWRCVLASIAPRQAHHPKRSERERRMPSYGTFFGLDPVRAVKAPWWRRGVLGGWNGTAPISMQPTYTPTWRTGSPFLDQHLGGPDPDAWVEGAQDLLRDELDLEELEHDHEPGAALLLLLHHGLPMPAPLRPILEPLGPPSRTIAKWRSYAKRGQSRPIELLAQIDAHCRPFVTRLQLWPSQIQARAAKRADRADHAGWGPGNLAVAAPPPMVVERVVVRDAEVPVDPAQIRAIVAGLAGKMRMPGGR